jgi:hypothetical protein
MSSWQVSEMCTQSLDGINAIGRINFGDAGFRFGVTVQLGSLI